MELDGPAPSNGAVVTLTSSDRDVARVPASVTVLAGQTTANFTVTTFAVSVTTTVPITASYQGRSISKPLKVTK